MRLLWIGPWVVDTLCNQFNGSMAQAIHDVGNEIGGVIIGERGSWVWGGYDWVEYCPVRRSVFDKVMTQIYLSIIAARFGGDVLILGEKVSHLAAIAWLSRGLWRKEQKIVLDVRTLPIPSDENYEVEPRGRRYWLQLSVGFRFADGWMAITPRLRDAVGAHISTRGLPCAIWESAVDKKFLSDCGNSEMAAQIRACGHRVNLLYLGSLSQGRRIDLAIRGMRELGSDAESVGLHIVGAGSHEAYLRSLVISLGLESSVHIWGSIPYSAVPSTIAACDLGILPLPSCNAWNTSSALKLYEYLGVGRPVLVSDIPAHRDAVGGQPFAFFMNEYSVAGFDEAVVRFIGVSSEGRRAISDQAREFVRERHTWDHRARTIHAFLTGLTDAERG